MVSTACSPLEKPEHPTIRFPSPTVHLTTGRAQGRKTARALVDFLGTIRPIIDNSKPDPLGSRQSN